uniref:Uncharacterized protein n=1 Tax=Ascaris lumbricoides TaxID=6252 RepID=A0A0M3I0B5_ASCLU
MGERCDQEANLIPFWGILHSRYRPTSTVGVGTREALDIGASPTPNRDPEIEPTGKGGGGTDSQEGIPAGNRVAVVIRT